MTFPYRIGWIKACACGSKPSPADQRFQPFEQRRSGLHTWNFGLSCFMRRRSCPPGAKPGFAGQSSAERYLASPLTHFLIQPRGLRRAIRDTRRSASPLWCRASGPGEGLSPPRRGTLATRPTLNHFKPRGCLKGPAMRPRNRPCRQCACIFRLTSHLRGARDRKRTAPICMGCRHGLSKRLQEVRGSASGPVGEFVRMN